MNLKRLDTLSNTNRSFHDIEIVKIWNIHRDIKLGGPGTICEWDEMHVMFF